MHTKMIKGIFSYQDRWKKFLKKAISKIWFLSHSISDIILENLFYELESERYEAGDYIFKQGYYWDWIYIVIHGKVDVFINNNGKDSYIETLTQYCNIGAYSILFETNYSFSWKASTDWALILLKHDSLEKWRALYEELDYYITQYENFADKYGFPYWDFYVYHSKMKKLCLSKILIGSINRLKRILKSYSRKIEFGDILKRVLETIKAERINRKKINNKRHKQTENKVIFNSSETDKLKWRLEEIVKKISEQSEMIKTLMNN